MDKKDIFVFYTALYGSWKNDLRVVFRVRADRKPEDRAKEKGIKYYDRLVLSTTEEIQAWINNHKK
jgi:hypothetical protein